MAIFLIMLLGVAMGIIFGFALEKSQVVEPEVIIEQFQLKRFIMLKVFLTAIATGLVVYTFFFNLIGIERLNWKVMIVGSDVVGGALLGVGIALAGTCPGTVFAQIGSGYRDALVTLFGALLGALVFAKTKPFTQAHLFGQWPKEKVTLEALLGVPYWVVAMSFFVGIVLLLVYLEKRRSWRDELKDKLTPERGA